MECLSEFEWQGKRVAFMVPEVGPGSGGLQTICRHAAHLQALGAKVGIIVVGRTIQPKSYYLDVFAESYECFPDEVHLTPFCGENFDVVVATYFETTYFLPLFPNAKWAYFIQDRESAFFPAGDARFDAESTYGRDIPSITIGRWLAHELAAEHGAWVQHTDFSADQDIYHDLGHARERAICVVYQPEKPRRCSQMVEATLELIHSIDPSIRFVLYGSDVKPQVDFPVDFRGLVSKSECNEIYNECLAGLCISASNPSRVPFEMMAAGLVPVDVHQPHTLWDYPDDCVLLAEPNAASLATALLTLVQDDALREKLSAAGMDFMNGRKSGSEEQGFTDALTRIAAGNSGSAFNDSDGPWYAKSPIRASKEMSELAAVQLIGRCAEWIGKPATDARARSGAFAMLKTAASRLRGNS